MLKTGRKFDYDRDEQTYQQRAKLAKNPLCLCGHRTHKAFIRINKIKHAERIHVGYGCLRCRRIYQK